MKITPPPANGMIFPTTRLKPASCPFPTGTVNPRKSGEWTAARRGFLGRISRHGPMTPPPRMICGIVPIPSTATDAVIAFYFASDPRRVGYWFRKRLIPSNFLFFNCFPVKLVRSDSQFVIRDSTFVNGRRTHTQFQHHRPHFDHGGLRVARGFPDMELSLSAVTGYPLRRI